MQAAIRFTNVTKRFKQNTAVDNVTFAIETGTVVALLGPNGAGKSTSISMMLGLSRPTTGSVQLLGGDPTIATNRRDVGAMLQQVNLPPGLTVQETIDLFRSFYPSPLPANDLVDLADLRDERKQRAEKLSGGQRRRLQFALAMAGNPLVLFLDEPTTAMDVNSRRTFWERLRAFATKEGKTIILTTHHLEEADGIADRILLLQHGRIIADGSPSHVKGMTGFCYVSFVAGPTFEQQVIHSWPYVDSVELSGRNVRIRTKDSDAVLRALIGERIDASDFQITTGALEDAFIHLTENDDTRRVI